MIFDVSIQFEELIKNAIKKQIDTLPISYPCKVKSVKDDGVFVEVEVMLPQEESDTPTIIPIMQSPYLTLPIKEGDLGIALNCTYLFQDMIEDKKIEETQKSIKENGLFFIPIVSKSGFKGKVGETLLSSQNFKSYMRIIPESIELKTKAINSESEEIQLKIGSTTKASFENNSITLQATSQSALTMGNDVSLASGSTIEIKGISSTLGEILGDILTMLTNMNLDLVAGNGAPLNSPSLTSNLPQIISKVQGNLK